MSIAILLRKVASPNRFRDAFLASLSVPGTSEILICSGFFQEYFKQSPYQISQEGRLARRLAASKANVITVGIHNYSWLGSYRQLCRSLRAANVQLDPRCVSGLKWHAKVLIVSNQAGPFFGIVGSSNLTKNAFGTSSPFNYETDVLLWIGGRNLIGRYIRDALTGAAPDELIRASYSRKKNGGLSLRDWLWQLREDVLSFASKPLNGI